MKRLMIQLAIIAVLFSSCVMHNGLTNNANVHNTEVVLAKKNFKVVARIRGEAEAKYFLGIGGFSRNGLIEKARTDMLSKVDIVGSSKAIINETVEVKTSSFIPIFFSKKVVVTAYVVEFTE